MDQVVYDESGALLSGCFYRFGVQFSDDFLDLTEPDLDETWIVAKRTPTNEELRCRRPGDQTWVWVRTGGPVWDEEKGEYRDVEVKWCDCPADPSHVTHSTYSEYELEVEGGTRVGDIVPEFSHNVVLSASFAAKLRESGLTGFNLVRPAVVPNDDRPEEPDLRVLRSLGRGGRRSRRVVGVPNACPYCGAGPLICGACGYEEVKCPRCSNITRILSSVHKGAGDKRLRMAAEPKAGEILDGSRWDGSDFFGSSYVTRRAVDWLLSVHAAPFYARPVRVWTDKMSDEQKKCLERAKKPVGEWAAAS